MADGLAREGWDADILYGKAQEDAFAHVLFRSRYELKSDDKCRDTGYVFVEYEQKGRPSGIQTTESDWWVERFDVDCYVILPTERMKQLVRRAIREGRVKMGGDHNRYKGALVPVTWLVGFPGDGTVARKNLWPSNRHDENRNAQPEQVGLFESLDIGPGTAS